MRKCMALFLRKMDVIQYLSEKENLPSSDIAYIVDTRQEIIDCYMQELLSSQKMLENLIRLDGERRGDIER